MTIGAEFPRVLQAARKGDEWAWRVLYRGIAPTLLGYLALRSDNPDDICSDVFYELVRRLPHFEGDEREFRAWVFLIARHRLVDEHRRRSRRRDIPTPPELMHETITSQQPEEMVSPGASDTIREVLSRLPASQREVVLLRVVAGLSVAEAGRVMRRRPGAIRALQHRAIKTLRRELDKRNAIGLGNGS